MKITTKGKAAQIIYGIIAHGDDPSKLADYALTLEAQRSAGAGVSAKKRREDAARHWTLEWLEAAHAANPTHGARMLAQAARKLVAINRPDIPAATRDDLTRHRAESFLRSKKSTK